MMQITDPPTISAARIRIGAASSLLRMAAIVIFAAATGCVTQPNPSLAAGDTSLSGGEGPSLLPVHDGSEATGDEETGETALPITTEPWSFGERKGVRVTTPHYRIHTTIQHDNLVEHLPAFYESALEHYTTALTDLPLPEKPLESYIFQTRLEWKAKTRQMLPDEYATFENLGRGGFTTRGIAVLYYIDSSGRSRSTLSIAAHEGWHQYSQMTFRNPLPIWLEEGLAAYMESFRLSRAGTVRFRPSYNRERSSALRKAAHLGNLVKLEELLRHTPQTFLERKGRDALLVYYAQVWALARFLAEGADGRYREGLEDLLRDAAEGRLAGRLLRSTALTSGRQKRAAVSSRVGRAAALEYFNRDWAAFEDEYDAYVKGLAGTRTDRGRRGGRR
ncbi:MAG: hypothetical protein JSV91_00265 [Phycisphaerales bacterium]|nr:MAG: hypothetical protein JSV91_00265 [Phycisphaerales bacterium]